MSRKVTNNLKDDISNIMGKLAAGARLEQLPLQLMKSVSRQFDQSSKTNIVDLGVRHGKYLTKAVRACLSRLAALEKKKPINTIVAESLEVTSAALQIITSIQVATDSKGFEEHEVG